MDLEILQTLFSATHFYVAVAVPLLIIIVGEIFFKHIILWKELPWLTISWALTYYFAYWVEESTALILTPFSVLIVILTAYKHRNWSVFDAYCFTYLSFFVIDCLAGFNTLYSDLGWWYLTGIGGAGFKDGLVIFPTLTAAMVYYINLRKKGKLRLSWA